VCNIAEHALQCITNVSEMGFYMKAEMLTTRIDHDTKVAFSHICDEIGLSTSQAIKLFAKAVINSGGIPFELKIRQPNANTLAAIQELEDNKGYKASNVNQLLNELTEGKITNAPS